MEKKEEKRNEERGCSPEHGSGAGLDNIDVLLEVLGVVEDVCCKHLCVNSPSRWISRGRKMAMAAHLLGEVLLDAFPGNLLLGALAGRKLVGLQEEL